MVQNVTLQCFAAGRNDAFNSCTNRNTYLSYQDDSTCYLPYLVFYDEINDVLPVSFISKEGFVDRFSLNCVHNAGDILSSVRLE